MDVPHLQRFYRQYLQQFSNPIVPAGSFLKDDSIQLLLAERFFNETNFHRLPFEYQRKALDRVIKAIESSITDPEEEVSRHFFSSNDPFKELKLLWEAVCRLQRTECFRQFPTPSTSTELS